MKTLYCKEYNDMLIADFDKRSIKNINRGNCVSKYDFHTIYIAEDDMELRYEKNNKVVVKPVSKGDIVIQFNDFDKYVNPIVVLKNADMKENAIEILKRVEEMRARDTVEATYSDECKCCCDCAI